MIRFMMLTFAVLGWGFYELSGGSDFVSEPDAVLVAAKRSDSGTLSAAEVAAASPKATTFKTQQPALPAGVLLASYSGEMPASVSRQVVNDASPRRATTLVRLEGTPTQAKPLPTKAVQNASNADVRIVDGNRVNMRNGPGTNYGVLGKLAQGATVEVLEDNKDGWVKLRVAESGRVGWMADFLLVSAN